MKAPLSVRALSPVEQAGLSLITCLYLATESDSPRFKSRATPQSNRSRAFDVRRKPCATPSMRVSRKAKPVSSRSRADRKQSKPRRDQAKCEALRALLHRSLRTFGKATSCWILELAAEVSFEQGLTGSQVSIETIRLADPPAWGVVATSQRLPHQSRSRVPQEKTTA
jgi:hypothetical protein